MRVKIKKLRDQHQQCHVISEYVACSGRLILRATYYKTKNPAKSGALYVYSPFFRDYFTFSTIALKAAG